MKLEKFVATPLLAPFVTSPLTLGCAAKGSTGLFRLLNRSGAAVVDAWSPLNILAVGKGD